MSEEQVAPQVRERLWITKWDKSVDPPEPYEMVFVENGVVLERRPLTPEEVEACRREQALAGVDHALEAQEPVPAAPGHEIAAPEGQWQDQRTDAHRKRWE